MLEGVHDVHTSGYGYILILILFGWPATTDNCTHKYQLETFYMIIDYCCKATVLHTNNDQLNTFINCNVIVQNSGDIIHHSMNLAS